MSKRGGSRPAAAAGSAKAPAKGRKGTGASNGAARKQIGSRAFNRRARTAQPMHAPQRRLGNARVPPQLAERLMSAPYRELFRRVPRAAWICALVACLNAACWSIVMPPFQVTDEPDHFAYVKQLADTGTLPRNGGEETAPEELYAMIALHYYQVRQQPQNHTISSHREQAELESKLATGPRQQGSAAVGVAISQPPLYYALEAIPYSLAKSDSVLDRLQLMRLMSSLFAGLTALFAFLFVREALPGVRWAWIVGGLSVALAPLLGSMSGAVNPDAMLAAVSAALFYVLARAFRRGLDARLAAAIGVVSAIGFLTKLNFVGMAPGIVLGVVVLSVRAMRTSGRTAWRLPALALGIAFSPVVLFAAVNALSSRPTLGIVSTALGSTHGSLLAQLGYIWQMYLPRLPGMANDFPGLFTTRQLWFDNYVGLYGFLDTTFPAWVDTLALIPAGAIALLLSRSMYQCRASLASRWVEVAVYTLIGVGLLALVGADSYRHFPEIDAEYAQPRYALPLFALVGAALALAARAAGRRWGPVAGTLIVVLFLAHDVLSQMLVAGRFYA